MSTTTEPTGRAKCGECGNYFMTTKTGGMRWHCGTKYVGRWRQMCEGVGKPPAPDAPGGPGRGETDEQAGGAA